MGQLASCTCEPGGCRTARWEPRALVASPRGALSRRGGGARPLSTAGKDCGALPSPMERFPGFQFSHRTGAGQLSPEEGEGKAPAQDRPCPERAPEAPPVHTASPARFSRRTANRFGRVAALAEVLRPRSQAPLGRHRQEAPTVQCGAGVLFLRALGVGSHSRGALGSRHCQAGFRPQGPPRPFLSAADSGRRPREPAPGSLSSVGATLGSLPPEGPTPPVSAPTTRAGCTHLCSCRKSPTLSLSATPGVCRGLDPRGARPAPPLTAWPRPSPPYRAIATRPTLATRPRPRHAPYRQAPPSPPRPLRSVRAPPHAPPSPPGPASRDAATSVAAPAPEG